MAVTAHAVPTLEVPAADDMDLHSDNDIDFGDGDGDVDIDLEPTSAAHQDDDVSIHDAASVNGQEVFAVAVEQDDFMVDHEDVIEEDIDFQSADMGLATEQTSGIDAAVSQEHTLASLDEDLIDYSDDEGNEPQKNEAIPLVEADIEVQDAGVEFEEHEEQQHNTGDIAAAIEADQRSHRNQSSDAVEYDTTAREVDDQDRSSHSREQASSDHDGDDGGVLLYNAEHDTDSVESERDRQHDETQDDYERVENASGDRHNEHSSTKLQPVTVNYAGNELWLFKDHDPDDSGDWLLDNIALAKSTVSELFQACRSSLGDDVSHEHEIGFRFDHLHNLELYEDNTACVAVSLERLVELYHTLQAQDDINEPESFYMSLLFRPRFATLLSDVAKYAEQGSGYSALNAAVAAGETHFTNVFSGASTNEPTEWDNDESDEVDEADDVSNQESVEGEVQQENHQGVIEAQGHESEEDESQNHDDNDVEAEYEAVPHQAQDDPPKENLLSLDSADARHAHSEQQEVDFELHDDPVETAAQREQREGDLINYGDEEADDVEEAENMPATGPSPSPSTVQGDEATHLQDAASTAEVHGANLTQDDHQSDFDFGTGDDHEDQLEHQHTQDDNDATQSYQDYVQDFDQDDPFQVLQADEAEDFTANAQYSGEANQDFAAPDYQDLDQQLQVDFMNGAEFDEANDFTTTTDDLPGTNDFLDLDNAAEWHVSQEQASDMLKDASLVHDDIDFNKEEEDGVAEHFAPVVSSAANPAAVSSTETKTMSPQGQKRSVDEAGHGADEAVDSIDAKRPRV